MGDSWPRCGDDTARAGKRPVSPAHLPQHHMPSANAGNLGAQGPALPSRRAKLVTGRLTGCAETRTGCGFPHSCCRGENASPCSLVAALHNALRTAARPPLCRSVAHAPDHLGSDPTPFNILGPQDPGARLKGSEPECFDCKVGGSVAPPRGAAVRAGWTRGHA